MKVLTKRQREVYNYIVNFVKAKGYSPTIRDITGRFGFSSPATAHKYLVVLEQAGLIARGKRNALIQIRSKKDLAGDVKIPVLGMITAGRPIIWARGVEKDLKAVQNR
jgi:repressor LexA